MGANKPIGVSVPSACQVWYCIYVNKIFWVELSWVEYTMIRNLNWKRPYVESHKGRSLVHSYSCFTLMFYHWYLTCFCPFYLQMTQISFVMDLIWMTLYKKNQWRTGTYHTIYWLLYTYLGEYISNPSLKTARFTELDCVNYSCCSTANIIRPFILWTQYTEIKEIIFVCCWSMYVQIWKWYAPRII